MKLALLTVLFAICFSGAEALYHTIKERAAMNNKMKARHNKARKAGGKEWSRYKAKAKRAGEKAEKAS